MRGRLSLRTAALVLGIVWLALPPATARAEELGKEAGIGLASAFATLVYSPAKIVYAGLGGLVAGSAWVLSAGDTEVVRPIASASLRGDYVVTPSHLRGERPLEFVGRNPRQRHLAQESDFDDGF